MGKRVYIVEDNESMRIVLKRLLKKNFPRISDLAESENGETALKEIPLFNPDLVIVDLSLPGIDGIELIRRLKPVCSVTCILVVTGYEVDFYEKAAYESGAQGIVSKADDERMLEMVDHLLYQSDRGGCDR